MAYRKRKDLQRNMKRIVILCLMIVMITSCTANKEEEMINYYEYSIPKSMLSEETIEWLEKFNPLPDSSKIAVSYVPYDLAQAIEKIYGPLE